MTSTRILAIRHGETTWNVDTRIQGHTDIGLNEEGQWQAQQLAKALASEDSDAVYASDLSRAFSTAQAIAPMNDAFQVMASASNIAKGSVTTSAAPSGMPL